MNKITDMEMLKHLTIQALELTEAILDLIEEENIEKVLKKLDDRERVINIIGRLSKNQPSKIIENEFSDFPRIIEKISSMDEKIMTDLISLKNSTHLEIAKTFKTKENFKGYNLNNIK